MNLPQNLFDENVNVQTFLCQPDKTIIGEIMPYDYKGTFKFNSYSEISFTVDRTYTDFISGETKVHPCYELIDSLRIIYIRGVGHFIIQDVDEDVSDNESKSVTAFSLEYAVGQKYLENFYVNTGEEDSVETMYHAQQYGEDYNIDNYYTKVTDTSAEKFDPYQRYYKKEYTDTDTYNYVDKQILNAVAFEKYTGEDDESTLYIKSYPNVRFYWPTKPELSLLHLIFDLIPEWQIGYVDKELWYQERTFSEDRTSIYDFLYNTAADTLDFVMVWDSINGVVNFYKTTEDGVTTDTYVQTYEYNTNYIYYADDKGTTLDSQPTEEEVKTGKYFINIGQTVDTQWDTNVFISRDNLASQLDVKFSTDDIKTKLKITGSDDLDIRDVNLGQNYIFNLDYYNTYDWLGDLKPKYDKYKEKLATNTKEYQKFISQWSGAYNEYSDLMNYVPAEPRVMLIGDVFEKLYCVFNPYKPAPKEWNKDYTYYIYNSNKDVLQYEKAIPQPTKDTYKKGRYYVKVGLTDDELVVALQKKLNLYRVDQQDNGKRSQMAKTDDVLLTLEDKDSNSAVIRVRYDISKTADEKLPKEDYRVYKTLTVAKTGAISTTEYTLREWILGGLTAKVLGLSGFKIKSIGTLGAYLCLAKDETEEENIEEYGVKLLEEKQSVYTKIFIAQTEGYMSQEGKQCIAQDTDPSLDGPVADGTKWLDTDSDPLRLYIRDNTISNNFKWKELTSEDDIVDSANYDRYKENYDKLQVVQSVLLKKQKIADYLLNGFPINAIHLTKDDVSINTLLYAIIIHFMTVDREVVIAEYNLNNQYEHEGLLNGTILFVIDSSNGLPEIKSVKELISNNWSDNLTVTIPNITLTNYVSKYKVLSFTIDTDVDNEYAVYVIDGTPYVSYARSQGVCLAKMNILKEDSDMNNFFTKGELTRLSPFIREDEFSDSNFLLTGNESEEEQMKIKQELLKAGDEELKKICQPKLSFSATMANILDISEFEPLRKQFQLGNFVTVQIREGKKYTQKARLLEVQISFDDASDFSATFGNLISTKSQIDKHAELLQQAVSAGKSVAANSSKWQKAVDKSTKLDKAINEGLKDAALEVGSAEGQSISWDSNGIWGKKVDPITGEVDSEQFRIINNKLLFSNDGFKTSKAVFGKYTVNGETRWGPLAEYITANVIEGKFLKGGSIQIGDESNPNGSLFIVNEDGSVEIKSGGTNKYAEYSAVEAIQNAYQYTVELQYRGSTVFNTDNSSTHICAIVKELGEDITESLSNGAKFVWMKNGSVWQTNTVSSSYKPSSTFSTSSTLPPNQIKITSTDIDKNAYISCQVEF